MSLLVAIAFASGAALPAPHIELILRARPRATLETIDEHAP